MKIFNNTTKVIKDDLKKSCKQAAVFLLQQRFELKTQV